MSLLSLGMLLVSALLHAGWNLLVKGAAEKQVFTWWALLAGTIAFLPALLLAPLPSGEVWLLVGASAIAEAVYFVILTYSYGLGDFSLVYPLARGTAPALLALWAALFLGERPTPGGSIGLLLLLGGLLLVGSSNWFARRGGLAVGGVTAGVVAALGVACCISIYSAIDGAAMRQTAAPPYLVLVMAATTLLTGPAVLARYGAGMMLAQWREHWRRMLLVGVLMMVVYFLVLSAYSISRISYAGAIREISVVFGALAGWRLLGEGFGPLRTAGAALIFLGVVTIATLG